MIGILGGLCLYSTKVYCDLLKARTDSINQVSEDLAKENNVSVDVEKPFVEANAPPMLSIFWTRILAPPSVPTASARARPLRGGGGAACCWWSCCWWRLPA